MRKMRLKNKSLIILVVVFIVAAAVDVAWTDASLKAQMQRELQERGHVIALQMQETWNYLVEASDQDAYGQGGGAYAYVAADAPDSGDAAASEAEVGSDAAVNPDAGIAATAPVPDADENCAVAGRTISLTFTDASDYVTRYVSTAPRNSEDMADDFEREAIAAFEDDRTLGAYYATFNYGERPVFRYTEPMEVTELCLRCHGGPAGEIDVTGFPKEGLELGDVAGAVSVFVPMDSFIDSERQDLARSLFISIVLMVLVLVVVYLALARQNAQLEEANERLVAENQYKSDFLSMVSHELRTPLTSIIAFSDMLAGDEGLTERQETARKEIEANGRVLLLMINDILEMNRLDAGRAQLALGAVDVYDLMNFVEPVVAPIARRAGVGLECSVAAGVPVIEADFDKLAHALENLAFNAVKFTPEGGKVSIRAFADGERVRIAVSDTGIGIAPADQQRIFERFVQADSSTARRYNGTGLGLPLAQDYVGLHGGTLELESAVGEGSTFTISLPTGKRGESLDGQAG